MGGYIGQDRVVEGASESRSAGGRLVASDGRPLPLRVVKIGAEARGGLARVVLEQRFVWADRLRERDRGDAGTSASRGLAASRGGRRAIGESSAHRARRPRRPWRGGTGRTRRGT